MTWSVEAWLGKQSDQNGSSYVTKEETMSSHRKITAYCLDSYFEHKGLNNYKRDSAEKISIDFDKIMRDQ